MSTTTFSRPATEFERLCTNSLSLDTPTNGIILTGDLCRVAVNPVPNETITANELRSYGFIDSATGEWRMGWPPNAIYNGHRCWALFDAFGYSTVSSATLLLDVDSITGTPAGTYTVQALMAHGSGSAPPFVTPPTQYSHITDMPKTTASATVNLSGVTAGSTIEVNVLTIVQEVIAQPGWLPGITDLEFTATEAGVTNGNYATIQPISLRVRGTA